MTIRSLISVHDVMPETLDDVAHILEHLEPVGAPETVTLLVVPGRGWSATGLGRLREWASRGYAVAGHGWAHEAAFVRGLRHRLHAALISRNVAEHLALDAGSIRRLIKACHAWFGEHSLPAPTLYVPPAWAMGPVHRGELRDAPFRYYETLTGIYDARADRFERVPLVGYEADTRLRAWFLSLFNAANVRFARQRGRLRVAIHPRDFNLSLAPDLRRFLATLQPATIDAALR